MAYFVQFTQADIGVMSRVLAEDLGPTSRAYLAAVNAYDAAFGVGEGSESLIEAQALVSRINAAEAYLLEAKWRTIQRVSTPTPPKEGIHKRDLLEDWKPKRDLKKSLFLKIVISNFRRIYALELSKPNRKP